MRITPRILFSFVFRFQYYVNVLRYRLPRNMRKLCDEQSPGLCGRLLRIEFSASFHCYRPDCLYGRTRRTGCRGNCGHCRWRGRGTGDRWWTVVVLAKETASVSSEALLDLASVKGCIRLQ